MSTGFSILRTIQLHPLPVTPNHLATVVVMVRRVVNRYIDLATVRVVIVVVALLQARRRPAVATTMTSQLLLLLQCRIDKPTL